MRSASDKSCRENPNTFYCSVTYYENRAIYEIIWKKNVESGRLHDNMAQAHCMLDT